MAKSSLFVVTMPATLTVVVEAAGDKDAKETAAKTAELVFGKSLGVLSVVGEAKVQPVAAAGKVDKKSKKDDDDEEEEEETDEEEDEDEEEEDEDDDEEEDEDDEEEEDEDDAPVVKKSKKGDKKTDGKKKIKIKLKG